MLLLLVSVCINCCHNLYEIVIGITHINYFINVARRRSYSYEGIFSGYEQASNLGAVM